MKIPEGNVSIYMSVLTRGCTRLLLYDSQSGTIEKNTTRLLLEMDCNITRNQYFPGVVLKICNSSCYIISPLTKVIFDAKITSLAKYY
jgi:hypothetical protein